MPKWVFERCSMAEKNNSERQRVSEKLCRTLDIQPDIFPYGTLVELRGRSSVTVRGCGRVTEYTDNCISFAMKGGFLCIRGKRLSCASYCKGAAVVDGLIDSVSFEEERE